MTVQRFDFEDGRGLTEYRTHPNGGGRVAVTAQVEPSVYIGAGCWVSGYAVLKDNVFVSGRVRIDGDLHSNGVVTQIDGNARITGNVRVKGCPIIGGDVDIRDDAYIEGPVEILHRARIADQARLIGWVRVLDRAYICGSAELLGRTEKLEARDEAYLKDGTFQKSAELASAIKRSAPKLESTPRKRAAKA